MLKDPALLMAARGATGGAPAAAAAADVPAPERSRAATAEATAAGNDLPTYETEAGGDFAGSAAVLSSTSAGARSAERCTSSKLQHTVSHVMTFAPSLAPRLSGKLLVTNRMLPLLSTGQVHQRLVSRL